MLRTTWKIQFVDVTGFKHVIKAKLVNCGKLVRYLKILENIGVRNAAKDLRHPQALTLVLGYQNLSTSFSRLEPFPIHSTVIRFHYQSVLVSLMKLLS